MPISSILGGLFGGPKTTTSGSNPLWDLQSQHLPGIYNAAADIYNQGPAAPYPGSTVAGFDPVQAQGLNIGVDAALGPQQQLADAYTSGILGIAQGTDPTTQRLAQQAGTAVGQAAAGAGALGSARGQLAQNTAAGNVIANRQLDALSQIPQAQTAALKPGQTLSGIGQTFQGHTQDVLDADVNKYETLANQPFNWLGQYQNVIGPASAPTTTTSSTGPDFGGIVSGIGGLLGFANGGEVPTQRVEGAAPGIYEDVPTQQVNYAGTDWQRPQPSHGWAIVDGRYQLVPRKPDPVDAQAPTSQPYQPTPIEYNPYVGHTTLGAGSGSINPVSYTHLTLPTICSV